MELGKYQTVFFLFVFIFLFRFGTSTTGLSSRVRGAANHLRNKHWNRVNNVLEGLSDGEGSISLSASSVHSDGSDSCCQNSQSAVNQSSVNKHDQQQSKKAVVSREDSGVDHENRRENEASDVDGRVNSPDVTKMDEIVVEGGGEFVGGKAGNQVAEE